MKLTTGADHDDEIHWSVIDPADRARVHDAWVRCWNLRLPFYSRCRMRIAGRMEDVEIKGEPVFEFRMFRGYRGTAVLRVPVRDVQRAPWGLIASGICSTLGGVTLAFMTHGSYSMLISFLQWGG